MLFDLWFDVPHRPTRDADFLGFGPMDTEALASTMREVCGVAVEDGMEYDPARSPSRKYVKMPAMAACAYGCWVNLAMRAARYNSTWVMETR
ncbi:MAG: nucleotidyl transferase AbiEii/AbiGii toxin family protein [Pseudomonadota bacterium]